VLAALMLTALVLLAAACGNEATLTGDTAPSRADAAVEPTTANAKPTAVSEPGGTADPTPDARIAIATPERAASTTQPEPDVEPESGASAPMVVAVGGATDGLLGVTLTIGETVAGSGDLRNFAVTGAVDAEPGADGHWLMTRITVDSSNGSSIFLSDTEVELEAPDGTRYPADAIFNLVGENVHSIVADDRNTVDLRVAFGTPQLIGDTQNWNLVMSEENGIPVVLPLSGSAYDDAYPVQLLDGIESTLHVDPRPTVCANGAEFMALIEQANILLEGPFDRGSLVRVPAGERFLAIDLALTGQAQTTITEESIYCGWLAEIKDFLLMVDGSPYQPLFAPANRIEGFATVTVPMLFQIPANATRLELIGGDDGAVLAAWDVAIPVAVGEPGASLVPFDAQAAPVPPVVPGPRPTDPQTTTLSEGGAVGTMLFVDYTVGTSTSTNVRINGEVTNRIRIVTELTIESTIDIYRSHQRTNFVLEDPTGRAHQAFFMTDRAGNDSLSVSVNGIESRQQTLYFETDGLVSDLDGWRLLVHKDGERPLELPLVGAATEDPYPLELNPGESTTVTTAPYVSCVEPALEAAIAEANVGVEGPTEHFKSEQSLWARTGPASLLVAIQLDLTNLVDDNFCGRTDFWPEFLLQVDGRLTQPFKYGSPNLAVNETGAVALNYVIPSETQRITLVAGSGRTPIATWDLKDPSQVLQDLGAAVRNNQTVITLDETLLFAFGESTLQQAALAPLNRVANVIISESTGQINIVGHTDAIGDDDSNLELSRARAQAVAQALEEAGIDPDQLVVSGVGETSPVAPNTNDDGSDNPAGRQENRRVEISFTTSS